MSLSFSCVCSKKQLSAKYNRKNNKPTQVLNLAVGTPVAALGAFDTHRKVHMFSIECDLW